MSRKQREESAERLAQIARHLAWARVQHPMAQAVGQFAAGGTILFAPSIPDPPEGLDPMFQCPDLERLLLVPELVEEPTTIPAGYALVQGLRERRSGFVCLTQFGRPVGVRVGLEISLPAGETAVLVQTGKGFSVVTRHPEQETDRVNVDLGPAPASAPEGKTEG
jgi:hypothetical protein